MSKGIQPDSGLRTLRMVWLLCRQGGWKSMHSMFFVIQEDFCPAAHAVRGYGTIRMGWWLGSA